MSESHEHEWIRKSLDQLENLPFNRKFLTKLYSSILINDSQFEKFRTTGILDSEKNVELWMLLKQKCKASPGFFDEIMKCLESTESTDAFNILNECRSSQELVNASKRVPAKGKESTSNPSTSENLPILLKSFQELKLTKRTNNFESVTALLKDTRNQEAVELSRHINIANGCPISIFNLAVTLKHNSNQEESKQLFKNLYEDIQKKIYDDCCQGESLYSEAEDEYVYYNGYFNDFGIIEDSTSDLPLEVVAGQLFLIYSIEQDSVKANNVVQEACKIILPITFLKEFTTSLDLLSAQNYILNPNAAAKYISLAVQDNSDKDKISKKIHMVACNDEQKSILQTPQYIQELILEKLNLDTNTLSAVITGKEVKKLTLKDMHVDLSNSLTLIEANFHRVKVLDWTVANWTVDRLFLDEVDFIVPTNMKIEELTVHNSTFDFAALTVSIKKLHLSGSNLRPVVSCSPLSFVLNCSLTDFSLVDVRFEDMSGNFLQELDLSYALRTNPFMLKYLYLDCYDYNTKHSTKLVASIECIISIPFLNLCHCDISYKSYNSYHITPEELTLKNVKFVDETKNEKKPAVINLFFGFNRMKKLTLEQMAIDLTKTVIINEVKLVSVFVVDWSESKWCITKLTLEKIFVEKNQLKVNELVLLRSGYVNIVTVLAMDMKFLTIQDATIFSKEYEVYKKRLNLQALSLNNVEGLGNFDSFPLLHSTSYLYKLEWNNQSKHSNFEFSLDKLQYIQVLDLRYCKIIQSADVRITPKKLTLVNVEIVEQLLGVKTTKLVNKIVDFSKMQELCLAGMSLDMGEVFAIKEVKLFGTCTLNYSSWKINKFIRRPFKFFFSQDKIFNWDEINIDQVRSKPTVVDDPASSAKIAKNITYSPGSEINEDPWKGEFNQENSDQQQRDAGGKAFGSGEIESPKIWRNLVTKGREKGEKRHLVPREQKLFSTSARDHILKNISRLIDCTKNETEWLNHLLAYNILSPSAWQKINNTESDTDSRIREIYLESMKTQKFGLLIDSLKNCNNHNAASILEELFFKSSSARGKPKKYIWFGIKSGTHNYKGRERDLEIIHNYWLETCKDNKLSFLSITGLGGIGKSELAKQYAKQFHTETNGHCILINSESSSSFFDSFKKLADTIGISLKDEQDNEKTLQSLTVEVYEWLSAKKYLVIFDNLENYEEYFLECFVGYAQELPPSKTKPFVILTSRYQLVHKDLGDIAQHLNLKVLSEDSALSFFEDALKVRLQDVDICANLKILCGLLDNLPLAMQQAAAYINKQKQYSDAATEIKNYLESFEEESRKLLEHPLPKLQRFSKPTYLTWQISLDRIGLVPETGKWATLALNISSFFQSENIPLAFINAIMLFYISESWGTDVRVLYKRTTDTFKLLCNYSMCQMHKTKNIAYISIHRLVQEVNQIKLKKENLWSETVNKILQILYGYFPMIVVAEDLPHIRSLLNKIAKNSFEISNKQNFFSLLLYVHETYWKEYQYHECNEFNQFAIRQLENMFGKDSQQILCMMSHNGLTLRHLGDFKKAHTLLLEINRKQVKLLLDSTTPNKTILKNDSLQTRNNIGLVHLAQGNYDDALRIFLKVLEEDKQINGIEHPWTLITKSNVATIYLDKGNYTEGQRLLLEVEEAQQRVNGVEIANTLTTKDNTANAHIEQGNYQEALKISLEVLNVRARVFGLEHPSTSTTLNNIAVAHLHLGHYAEAMEIFLKLLEACERIYGVDHIRTLDIKTNIAQTHTRQGNDVAALKIFKEILEVEKRSFGNEHPDTLLTKNNIAIIQTRQGNYTDALTTLLDVLPIQERVIGVEHPHVLTTKNNIANIYDKQGNYSTALQIYLEIQAVAQRNLGNEHPYTVTLNQNIVNARLRSMMN